MPGKITHGRVLFNGENILSKTAREMQQLRGRDIAMIFQEPMVALNPAFKIGDQVAESYMLHTKMGKQEAYLWAAEMLKKVGIPNPSDRIKSYPHEFSGGMRQRVVIAIALALNPSLLIADEPTTALDVTIQAQVLNLLKDLIGKLGKALIFITHDLGVANVMCDNIAVMYAGNIVELAKSAPISSEQPLHPYTRGLIRALPQRGERRKRLDPIPGDICDLLNPPEGCKFSPRCEQSLEGCSLERPIEGCRGENHWIACHLYE